MLHTTYKNNLFSDVAFTDLTNAASTHSTHHATHHVKLQHLGSVKLIITKCCCWFKTALKLQYFIILKAREVS